jgi:hypothetical protein
MENRGQKMSKIRRRVEITIEQLEERTLLTTVILADLDAGAVPITSFAQYSWATGIPTTTLTPYLTQQYSTINGPAVPEAPTEHYVSHGTTMAAYYALLMQSTGDRALVQPIAVGPAADGSVSSVAIGLALQFVAAEQVAAQKAGADIRYVVSIPIEPGGVWSVDEVTGLVACINANMPISQAAGNDYYHFVIPEFPNELITEAMQPNGSFYPYSNVGALGTPMVLPVYDLGTSGASLAGAAWLAKELEAYPTISAFDAVSVLHNAGPLGLTPHAIAPPPPVSPKPVHKPIAHKLVHKPIAHKLVHKPIAHKPVPRSSTSQSSTRLSTRR